VRYRPSPPDAARLDFATVAAYEETTSRGRGWPTRKSGTCHINLLTLAKWTDEGIRNIKDSPTRRQAFEDRITAMGGTVKDAYLVMGRGTSWS
jgi:hypothetical protein